MKLGLLVASALLICRNSSQAQSPPPPPWGLGMEDVVAIPVPPVIRSQLDDLEYEESDTIKGVEVDLNGDGRKDYVIEAAPSLCGNGGCPWAIFDAAGRELGQVGGSLVYFRRAKVHGFPIIESYSHLSAESATYTTYTFNGTVYVASSTRTMQGASLDSLDKALRRIPLWHPR